ncbi:hypothetical protein MY5147_006729 [Beauveria neobassiana]|uniref:Phosphatidate cytidylyltransferase n=1 Tax=Beauveria bassiana TaxID=176275 RepID=A0A2S7YDT9_BEABA|nr:hypothetical protein BB8028_0004g10330 [Beauveria bassiana]
MTVGDDDTTIIAPVVSPNNTSDHATAPPWSLFALHSHDTARSFPHQPPPSKITADDHNPTTCCSPIWPSSFASLRRILAGPISCSPLPPIAFTMSLRRKAAGTTPMSSIDTPPRTAEPSDDVEEEYTAPRTRSGARRRNVPPTSSSNHQSAHDSSSDADSVPGKRKSRTRSRSPVDAGKLSRMTPRITETPTTTTTASSPNGKSTTMTTTDGPAQINGGLLAPPPAAAGWSWRDLSRSRSPLGLIPIHRHFKTFVHKHEVPRKALHVSIGFFVVWLYSTGTQTSAVAPYLMTALVPVAATDLLRHRFAPVNRLYVRALGALMRESEYDGYNGVIWYLLGAWSVLYALPKDVGVMSVLLLSWCDTAASTFGRLWGRYTIRLRRGKSLAGSLAAFAVGVATSVFFYGWLVPTVGPMPGDEGFMFKNVLALPAALVGEENRGDWSITGSLALGVMSLVSGVVASASEVVDIFGWDDNLTIPVLSGLGIYGFLKVFG